MCSNPSLNDKFVIYKLCPLVVKENIEKISLENSFYLKINLPLIESILSLTVWNVVVPSNNNSNSPPSTTDQWSTGLDYLEHTSSHSRPENIIQLFAFKFTSLYNCCNLFRHHEKTPKLKKCFTTTRSVSGGNWLLAKAQLGPSKLHF